MCSHRLPPERRRDSWALVLFAARADRHRQNAGSSKLWPSQSVNVLS